MWSEYPSLSGTVAGEIKNEIYNRYGQEIMESAIYGWDNVSVDEFTLKEYTLINSRPRHFLITTIKYYPLVQENLKERVRASFMPETIHFEWVTTNIEFLPKYTLNERGIPYSL
jgi:hypothetical protein